MSEDFFSFDEAMDELQMEEEELQGLISQGELKAYRDEDTMKLRREDIIQLKKKGGAAPSGGAGAAAEEPALAPAEDTEPTIILPSGDDTSVGLSGETDIMDFQTDEILGLDEMVDLGDVDEASQTSIPTIELAMDEEEEKEDASQTSDLLLDSSFDQEATSQLEGTLDLADDDAIPTVLDTLDEEEDELEPTVAETRTGRSSRVSAIQMAASRGPMWPTVLLGLCLLPFVLVTLMMVCSYMTLHDGKAFMPDYIAWFADWFRPQI